LSNLPLSLQEIMKNKVKQNKTNNKYLLKVGLYPELYELLCNTSLDSLNKRLPQQAIHSFLVKHIKFAKNDYMKLYYGVANEIRDIHQSYMLEFYKDSEKADSKANRKKRTSAKIIIKDTDKCIFVVI